MFDGVLLLLLGMAKALTWGLQMVTATPSFSTSIVTRTIAIGLRTIQQNSTKDVDDEKERERAIQIEKPYPNDDFVRGRD